MQAKPTGECYSGRAYNNPGRGSCTDPLRLKCPHVRLLHARGEPDPVPCMHTYVCGVRSLSNKEC